MNEHDRLNDELLVLQRQEGDAEAFELLVGRWQGRLWRHAWRLTGNESAAWNAIQEAWIGISRGINRLADVAAFPAWAYQIVGNKCRDTVQLPEGAEVVSVDPPSASGGTWDGTPARIFRATRGRNEAFACTIQYRLSKENSPSKTAE